MIVMYTHKAHDNTVSIYIYIYMYINLDRDISLIRRVGSTIEYDFSLFIHILCMCEGLCRHRGVEEGNPRVSQSSGVCIFWMAHGTEKE